MYAETKKNGVLRLCSSYRHVYKIYTDRFLVLKLFLLLVKWYFRVIPLILEHFFAVYSNILLCGFNLALHFN